MKTRSRMIVFCGLAALGAAAFSARADGIVDVKFSDPSRYIDAGRTPKDIQITVDTLEAHLKKYAPALPAGQTLHIEVLDVDLAGTVITRPAQDTRVQLGNADAPRIKLRYQLEGGSGALQSGEETLTDLNYTRSVPHPRADEKMPYETHMLDVWFAERFAAARPQ